MAGMPLVRCATALAATAVALVTAATPVLAHGGSGAAFRGAAGPYTVYAYDGRPTDRAGAVEYRVLLLDSRLAPLYGARVTVSADLEHGGRRVGPTSASPVANIYYYELPDPGISAWEVHLTVSAAAGTGTVTYSLHGLLPGATAAAVSTGASGGGNDRTVIVIVV